MVREAWEQDYYHPGFENIFPDSHDAYAGVFLNLVAIHVEQHKDEGLLARERWRLKLFAWDNILNSSVVKSNGLIQTHHYIEGCELSPGRPCPVNTIGYLMDQCEVYAGLMSFGRVLSNRNDVTGDLLLERARALGQRIHEVFFDGRQWRANDVEAYSSAPFYPNAPAQIYPQLYDVRSGDDAGDQRRFDAGWTTLNSTYPSWSAPGATAWACIPYCAALRRKDLAGAANRLAAIYAEFLPGMKNDGRMKIHDIAFARATERLLGAA